MDITKNTNNEQNSNFTSHTDASSTTKLPPQIQKYQDKLNDYYKTEEGKKHKGEKITQKELGEMVGREQWDVSRDLSGYEIDWETGIISKEPKANDLLGLVKGTTIIKPSVFCLIVSQKRRKKLKEALEKAFPYNRKDKTPGIISIIEEKNNSALIILSNDHNLEYKLKDDNLLAKLTKELKSQKD